MFDELSTINNRSIPYDEYFDEMNLSEEEKEKRKKFSMEIEDVMLFIFALIITMRQNNYFNINFVIEELQGRFSKIVLKYIDLDLHLEEYIKQFSEEIIDVTIRHLYEPFYLSEDRAVLISENESNSIFNYEEYSKAIKSGKKQKRWVDIRDSRERETHREVGGMVIPIERAFVVGESLLLYPKDTSLGASMEEIANCRCTVEYF